VLPARIQVVRKDPLLIVDGGHNAPAFKSLVETINDLGVNPMRIILGLVKGKDHEVALRLFEKALVVRSFTTHRFLTAL